MRFVFGVPANDLPGEYNLELMYSEKKKAYRLSIETIFYFQSISQEIDYYTDLLNKFTSWMNEMNFDINKQLSLNDVCNLCVKDFYSIEDAYAWFRFVVESYVDRNRSVR